MPPKKPRQSAQARRTLNVRTKPPMPFSLILTPAEMAILRKEAARQGTSVGGVVRGAIHKVLFRTHSDFVRRMVSREVASFLNTLRARHPGTRVTTALRARIRKQVISSLLK